MAAVARTPHIILEERILEENVRLIQEESKKSRRILAISCIVLSVLAAIVAHWMACVGYLAVYNVEFVSNLLYALSVVPMAYAVKNFKSQAINEIFKRAENQIIQLANLRAEELPPLYFPFQKVYDQEVGATPSSEVLVKHFSKKLSVPDRAPSSPLDDALLGTPEKPGELMRQMSQYSSPPLQPLITTIRDNVYYPFFDHDDAIRRQEYAHYCHIFKHALRVCPEELKPNLVMLFTELYQECKNGWDEKFDEELIPLATSTQHPSNPTSFTVRTLEQLRRRQVWTVLNTFAQEIGIDPSRLSNPHILKHAKQLLNLPFSLGYPLDERPEIALNDLIETFPNEWNAAVKEGLKEIHDLKNMHSALASNFKKMRNPSQLLDELTTQYRKLLKEGKVPHHPDLQEFTTLKETAAKQLDSWEDLIKLQEGLAKFGIHLPVFDEKQVGLKIENEIKQHGQKVLFDLLKNDDFLLEKANMWIPAHEALANYTRWKKAKPAEKLELARQLNLSSQAQRGSQKEIEQELLARLQQAARVHVFQLKTKDLINLFETTKDVPPELNDIIQKLRVWQTTASPHFELAKRWGYIPSRESLESLLAKQDPHAVSSHLFRSMLCEIVHDKMVLRPFGIEVLLANTCDIGVKGENSFELKVLKAFHEEGRERFAKLNDPLALRFKETSQRENKPYVLAQVLQNPLAYQFAAQSLQQDLEIAKAAIEGNKNKSFVLEVLKRCPQAYSYINTKWKKDPLFTALLIPVSALKA